MKTRVVLSKAAQVRSSKSGRAKNTNHNSKKELVHAEILQYLMKLQEIVPILPKKQKGIQIEVISNVIEYIHDLRVTLELPACSAIFDVELTLKPTPTTITLNSERNNVGFLSSPNSIVTPTSPPHHHRKPLCAISNPKR